LLFFGAQFTHYHHTTEIAMNEPLSTTNKDFVGIGKLLLDTSGTEWNIPHLHFLVDKADDGMYEAANLELALIAAGETQEEAVKRMVDLTQHHIIAVITEGSGLDEFCETVNNSLMDRYWQAYRLIEFTLAKSKMDLSHAVELRMNEVVEDMISNKTKEFIRQISERQASDIIDRALIEFEKASKLRSIKVRYKEVRKAA
jgi:hypothetical protein